MEQSAINLIRYGHEAPLPHERQLRAGPLTLLYSEGDLRAIRLGDREILNRVYVAVRDHNWDTIPALLSDVLIEEDDDSFRIRYNAAHRQEGIDFHWRGTIVGQADGTITFEMDGEARSTFQRNRIGFCVLHPAHLAGVACTVEYVDGRSESSIFPERISPHQPFYELRTIRHQVMPEIEAEVRMEGDTFEMEDQRNWTDASYKTYCTPLGLPFPVEIKAGTPVRQRVTLYLRDDKGETPTALTHQGDDITDEGLRFTVACEIVGQIPRLGLGRSSQVETLDATSIARLRKLTPAHLRVDLDLATDDWQTHLASAIIDVQALDCQLEVALHLSDAAVAELGALRAHIDELDLSLQPFLQHWLIYHHDEKGISANWVELARATLGDVADVPFGAGTNAYFTELNRNPPPAQRLDLICYSINPQVHAFDNRSLMETLPVQRTTVESARPLAEGKPLAITPITLSPRFNPNATGEETVVPGELPSQVDVRQMSLFGAAWTVGSLKAIAESRVESVTYYETVGWRGVMESSEGAPLPTKFPSTPGQLFPLYFALADVAPWAGAEVFETSSSDAEQVDGLAWRVEGGGKCLLLANLTNALQEVTVAHGGNQARLHLLDEEVVSAVGTDAFVDPADYRSVTALAIEDGKSLIRLLPYAVARIDVT